MELIDIPRDGSGYYLSPFTPYPFDQIAFRPEVCQHIFYLPLLADSASLEWYHRRVSIRGCQGAVGTVVHRSNREHTTGTREEFWGFGHGTD